ncbi:hypothetical protein JOD43_002069 [Pullulanibacillus pueri]|uniref:Uncharacterized protein n=1 Tax=Pullulanibacillus pueri TaxID=1437324 RepID=A0A8J3EKZ5_9BACL|nr:hypothetical protein [Pullulanibacillus pueri]GGH76512.1 hypothetical protein GCM10007096_07050 [Pullulanibacillus pueri]
MGLSGGQVFLSIHPSFSIVGGHFLEESVIARNDSPLFVNSLIIPLLLLYNPLINVFYAIDEHEFTREGWQEDEGVINDFTKLLS